MKVRLASNLQKDSVVDGIGIRTVIWMQGCAHHCPFCHNPMTHDFNGGFEIDTKEIIKEINSLEGQTGVTFSGGDPIYQIEATIELAKACHKRNLNVWIYSGFTYEEIYNMPLGKALLKYTDTLVDGLFEIDKRSLDLPFRGSSNQRIIDVKKSTINHIVLKDNLMQRNVLERKNNNLYI